MAEPAARERCFFLDDVFVLILQATLADIDQWSVDAVRRGGIRLVCTQWRDTLDDNACLWTHIFISRHMHRHYIARVFKSAELAPKTVIINLDKVPFISRHTKAYPHRTGRRSRTFMDDLSEALTSHASSIVGLAIASISRKEWNAFVDALGDTLFPVLKTLAIARDKPRRRPQVSVLLPLSIPDMVQRLMLDNVPHFCISGAFSSLTSLSLSGRAEFIDMSSFPQHHPSLGTARVIMGALQHCLLLTSLRISDVDYSAQEELQPIELPLLQSLAFACNNFFCPHSCGRFLAFLGTPQLTSMALSISHTTATGVRQFAQRNGDKLGMITSLHLSGHWADYADKLYLSSLGNAESFLPKLARIVHLDMTKLKWSAHLKSPRMEPSVAEFYVAFLLRALRLPNLETLRIPHVTSSILASSLDVMKSAIASLMSYDGAHCPVTIIEDHARCSMSNHISCASYFSHSCNKHSPPHEQCRPTTRVALLCTVSPTDPSLWDCGDKSHSTCARTWSFPHGELEIGTGASLSPKHHSK
ncbi:hypothetical protein C8F01DRAFT_1232637 [Mycena amicta]|nr:hypothetical protein C8F01DRAFT_1232637 [Mycena amicta]